MSSAHLNRGLVILSVVATLVALGNAFLSGAFWVVFTCFDTCLNVGTSIASGQFSDLIALLVPLAALAPAVAIILACWIWELVELRRQGATRATLMTWIFPVFTLLVIIGVTLLTSVTADGTLTLYGTNVWYGTLALAIWPALVTLVALIWRGAATHIPVSPPVTGS
jgi:hypothetical protein